MKHASITAIVLMAATLACAAPAPYPLPVNSRSQTAPPVIAYAGNLNTYRVTLTDGNTASPIVGTEVPFMAWATNNTASVNSTGVCSVVSGTTGVFDVVFSPASVNFTAGRYIYEVGVKSNGVPRTYRQGSFQIVGSPVGGSVGSINWTTNLDWSTISWANLPSNIGATPTDTVARASIATLQGRLVDSVNGSTGAVTVATAAQGAKADTALQVEADPIALAVMATQQITRVWASDGLTFCETGVVWQVSQMTNYTVALSPDFSETFSGANNRPSWTTNVWPFVVENWQGGMVGYTLTKTDGPGTWAGSEDFVFPKTLSPTEYAQGTAVVSQHVSVVTNVYRVYASTTDLAGVSSNLANHVSTNAASVIAQSQPSTLTRYGDFATTNDAGYASFGTANPAEKYVAVLAPTNRQSLAKARYNVTASMGGILSFSAYVKSGPFNPETSNAAAYAVLTVYSAAGAVVASNIGATVSMAAGGISNLSTSVTLSNPVTNGYVVAEIFSSTNAASYVSPYAGGAYPLALYALNTPLNYLTKAEADERYAASVNSVAVNPTFGGSVTIGGVARDSWPEATAGAITNGWIGDTVKINNLEISKWPGGFDTRAFIDCHDYYGFAFQGSLVFYMSPVGASWPQNKMAAFGGNEDAVLYFDGTDMIIDSARVGTGKTRIKRDVISEGSLTAAEVRSLGGYSIFDSGSNCYWRVTASNGTFYASDTNGVRKFKFATETP